jgi:4-alpha-glucanotransferase
MIDVLARRRAGVLLHPTSLPGQGPVGTLGAEAYRFVDFLQDGGFSVWQTLPLGPADSHGSPYRLLSDQAGDVRLIDTEALRHLGELPASFAFDAVPDSPVEAYRSFELEATRAQIASFAAFVRGNRKWLVPYCLFRLCERRFGGEPWWRWPDEYRNPTLNTLFPRLAKPKSAFRGVALLQYLFERQWSALKRHAHARGVYLFGDLPFYADLNSVEVWWNRSLFRVGPDGTCDVVAGVPPDYFNADGQRWGNPLYDWEQHEAQEFAWWQERLVAQLKRFDLLRLDHFRALESYWEIPAESPTARHGHWRTGPGAALLTRLRERLGTVPLVAEDLGIITDEVRRLRDRFDLPGMVVLQFAFDGSRDNPHLPENHSTRAVVYTGTHDNDTTVGWYAGLDAATRGVVQERLGATSVDVPEAVVEAAYASRAQLAIVPLQDLLGQGSEARMNTPGTTVGNWRWRFEWRDVPARLTRRCRERAARHSRLVGGVPGGMLL